MTVHPAQRLLDGREHALADVGPTVGRRRVLASWIDVLTEPRTVAELAAAWWPEIGEPRGWTVGGYPRARIRAAWGRVRALERAGLVVVGRGPLRHRKQTGAVVMRARVVRGGRWA